MSTNNAITHEELVAAGAPELEEGARYKVAKVLNRNFTPYRELVRVSIVKKQDGWLKRLLETGVEGSSSRDLKYMISNEPDTPLLEHLVKVAAVAFDNMRVNQAVESARKQLSQ